MNIQNPNTKYLEIKIAILVIVINRGLVLPEMSHF